MIDWPPTTSLVPSVSGRCYVRWASSLVIADSTSWVRHRWPQTAHAGRASDAVTARRAPAADAKALRHEIHNVLRQANYDLAKHQFNTVASAAMKILNALERCDAGRHTVSEEGLSILLRLLAPITPHICHQLWRALGYGEDVMTAPWPEPDAAALARDEIEYVVQVNGKKKGSLTTPAALDAAGVERFARASDLVQQLAAGRAIRKVIVVPGRLINIVA